MSNKSRIYAFFVPEFIEAQRTSFLELLKTGIPLELEKHNPLELRLKSPKKDPLTGFQIKTENPLLNRPTRNSFKDVSDLETESSEGPDDLNQTSFDLKDGGSPRVQFHRLEQADYENLYNLKYYLTPINSLHPKEPYGTKKSDPFSFSDATENWPLIESPKRLASDIQRTQTHQDLVPFSSSSNLDAPKLSSFGLKKSYLAEEDSSPKLTKFAIYFHSDQYKFIPPRDSIETSILKSKTYSAPIYVPAELRNSSNQCLLSQWLLLGNLPLMTNRGHFIINGTARTILHQLVRSPGVYFYKKKQNPTHYADVICHRGVWLRIEIDKKGLLWVRMKNCPKIPMPAFLQGFGLEHPHFLSQLKPRTFLTDCDDKLKSKLKLTNITRNIFRSSRQARIPLDVLLFDPNTNEKFMLGRKHRLSKMRISMIFLAQRFSSKTYDLSPVGRLRLNQKLGLNKPLTDLTLTLDDLICITNYLIQVQEGEFEVDDIDNLKNRRVRCSGELILNQFGVGLINVERLFKKKEFHPNEIGSSSMNQIQKLLNTKPINGALKEFFNSNPLSQFLDQTNALAELTHKRRLSSLGPGGITRETAGMKIRSIHPSHYGRICPIETPEGPNAGLVNSLTTYARINQNGFLETPFYKVKNGQIQNENQVFYLSANQDETKYIAPPDLKYQDLAILKGSLIPTRLGNEFSRTNQQNIDFMSVSRIQMISVATSLIPFLEHDDANRALMGSNMQRQSVPLIRPERAIVGTGLEGRVVSDSGHSIQARESGFVVYASGEKIQVLSFFRKKKTLNKSKSESSTKSLGREFEAKIVTYPLETFNRSNQNTCVTQRPLVHEGDWVEKGACLVDCASSSLGDLAIGKNILIAYLPWEGYNFEDAILVSERLIYDDLFTSIHIVKQKTEIRETKYGPEKITRERFENDLPISFKNLDSNGIVRIGTWVTEGDILVRKVTPNDKQQLDPYRKMLYAILEKQIPTVKDTSLRVPKGLEGRVIDIQIRQEPESKSKKSTNTLNVTAVSIWIAEKKWLQVGDKMAGRHGNKGIVSQILPRQDMPYLPDGTPVDMVLNPLGVPSRMNVGQIYENLLGLAGRHLNQHYKVIPFDEVSGPEASRSLTFSKLYEAKLKTGKEWLFQPENPGKMKVFDGRTGEAFDQPVTIGQAYMLKLIHLVDEKIHARATGPYSLVTQQPLRGRSKRGGQRFGEMEVWALEGFGAAYTLQEILTIKSDDIFGRKQIMNYLFKDDPITIGRPESFRVLIRELQSLCLSVSIFDFPVRHEDGAKRKPLNLDSDTFNQY